MDPSPTPISDQWVIQICHKVEDESPTADNIKPSISAVPKNLRDNKPEAYIPLLVALGPYHRSHNDLLSMEQSNNLHYQISAVKRAKSQVDFRGLVITFTAYKPQICAHYGKQFEVEPERLACMMALDVTFLYEFLHIYATVNPLQTKPEQDSLLRDIIKLENQIPFFFLDRLLEARQSSSSPIEEDLSTMLAGFLNEVLPFKMEATRLPDITPYSHLLELVYCHSVPNPDTQTVEPSVNQSGKPFQNITWAVICFVPWLLGLIIKLLLKIVINLSTFVVVRHPWGQVLACMRETLNSEPQTEAISQNQNPLLQEITIPSVSELVWAGIVFTPRDGNVSTVGFDEIKGIFYLPKVNMDVNSEVVLRNLVAYEAAVLSGPTVFARYVELMNGIVDKEEDAVVLREAGVVVNRLKSDGEVAEMWNGLCKSVRLTRVPAIDKVIEDVNRYYNSRWKVKLWRVTVRCVDHLHEPVKFLVVIVLLFLMAIYVLQR